MTTALHGLAPGASDHVARLLTRPVPSLLPWLATVLVLSLLLPTETSFMIGTLRLSPYRVILLIAFVPLLANLISGRYGRLVLSDFLIIAYSVWAALALGIHHGFGAGIESGGILIVEAVGAYLIGRACVRSAQQFQALARLIVKVVLIVGAFTLVESVTGNHLIKSTFAAMRGVGFSSDIEPRYGFHRAYGPFDHPILWGVFAASAVGLSWYAAGSANEPLIKKATRTGLVAIAAATSVSAGAMAAMWAQFVIIGWDLLSRGQRHRWKALIACVISGYVVIDWLSNRSGMKVLLSYLTFSPATAYGRLTIWDWGFYENALKHPVFGIGINEWVRPSWMHSISMDNFWLFQMVTYGLPAFVLLAGAFISMGSHLRRLPRSAMCESARLAWATTVIGACVAACTVHYWNQAFVWFCLLLGSPSLLTDKSQLHGRLDNNRP